MLKKILEENYVISDGFVHVPVDEYDFLKSEVKKLRLLSEYYAGLIGRRNKKHHIYPDKVRYDLLNGEGHPVRIFRKYRKMSQQVLAKKVGVSKTMISHIESGRKQGSTKTLKNIAKALDVDLNDLI